jgi:Na+-driven multidrug efflux pump
MIGVVFLSEGKRLFYFLTLLISVLINIISNVITIPLYGMYGAAFSSVISYSICGLAFLIYFIRVKKVNFLDIILLKPYEIKQLKNNLKGK